MIVDVLNVQAGENLTEILETPASDEQVRLVLFDLLLIRTSLSSNERISFLTWSYILYSKTLRSPKDPPCFSRSACKNPSLEWKD